MDSEGRPLPASPVEAWWPGETVLRSSPTSQRVPGHTHFGVTWAQEPPPHSHSLSGWLFEARVRAVSDAVATGQSEETAQGLTWPYARP